MRLPLVLLVAVSLSIASFAANGKEGDSSQPAIVMLWPSQESAILKLSFSRFQNLASYGGKMTLSSDVIVQNVSQKTIPRASFTVALLDKDHVRIGSGLLVVDELSPSESAKVQFQCESLGAPSVLTISARNNGGVPASTRTIPMTVISVPAGAALKVDDRESGITPVVINVSAGTHQLQLAKEGFAVANTELDVAPNEAPGGSITITLGGLTDDTIELRDGTVINGTVVSMTLESVVVEISGQQQTFDRNKVKKMFLVEHIVTHPEPMAPASAPAPAKKN